MMDSDLFGSSTFSPPDVLLTSNQNVSSDDGSVNHGTPFDFLGLDAHLSGTLSTPLDACTDDILMSFDEAGPVDSLKPNDDDIVFISTAASESEQSLFKRNAYETLAHKAWHHHDDNTLSADDSSVLVDVPVPTCNSYDSGHEWPPLNLPEDASTDNDRKRIDLLMNVDKAEFEYSLHVDAPVCSFDNIGDQHVELPVNKEVSENFFQNVEGDIVLIFENSEQDSVDKNLACTGSIDLLATPNGDPIREPDPPQVHLSNIALEDCVGEYSRNFGGWHTANDDPLLPAGGHFEQPSVLEYNGNQQVLLPIHDELELLSSPTQDNSRQVQYITEKPSEGDSEEMLWPARGGSEQLLFSAQEVSEQELSTVQNILEESSQDNSEQLRLTVESQSQLLTFTDLSREENFADPVKTRELKKEDVAAEFDFDMPPFIPQIQAPNMESDQEDVAGDFDFDMPRFVPRFQTPNTNTNQEVRGSGEYEQSEVLDVASLSMDITFCEGIPTDENAKRVTSDVNSEWNQVQSIVPVSDVLKGVATEEVAYGVVLQHLDRSALIQQYSPVIRTSIERRGFAAFLHRLCGGPQLNRSLHDERNFTFCIAALPFCDEDAIHLRVLQTIYKKLTGNVVDCPRFGSHWEQIGFQGQNPVTDLRSVGFLSLLQLLHFVTEPKSRSLALDIYKLSLNQTQSFPFALMGINLTRIALSALREGCLNKECNRRGAVLSILNDFYHGTYHQLYTTWRYQHKTIADSGFVLAELETYVKQNSSRVIESTIKIVPSSHNSRTTDFNNFVEITDEETLRRALAN